LLFPEFPDLGRGNSLIVAIVPFADVLGDFDPGLARQAFTGLLAMGFPGQLILEFQVEQLQGALGSPSW
jgi:hypothetical protein